MESTHHPCSGIYVNTARSHLHASEIVSNFLNCDIFPLQPLNTLVPHPALMLSCSFLPAGMKLWFSCSHPPPPHFHINRLSSTASHIFPPNTSIATFWKDHSICISLISLHRLPLTFQSNCTRNDICPFTSTLPGDAEKVMQRIMSISLTLMFLKMWYPHQGKWNTDWQIIYYSICKNALTL